MNDSPRNRKGVTTISVKEKQLLSTASAPIRVEPVQARSTARVNALLDAACETMHDLGYEQLTTAMVADRAGASIGTVYRYFPDRIAVLQSVASETSIVLSTFSRLPSVTVVPQRSRALSMSLSMP